MTSISDTATAPRTVHVQRVMGTVVSFDLRRTGDHAAGIAAAVAWFTEVDERFSTYRPDSEASRFGRGEVRPDAMSADLREVVAACDAIAAVSGGAFDARRAGRFDPAAYVKGWSVERAGRLLRAAGCEDWTVNAGGDVLVASSDRSRSPWRIGVQHPFDRSATALVLEAHDLAVATSGRYERGDHILDPRTERPATAAASTTVCGADLGLADAFATAAFVLGDEGPAWIAGIPGCECWTVLDDGRVLATDGFPRMVAGVPVRTSGTTDPLGPAR
ncbi:FAD:protein FMN transferase [Amnibacterium soli]|uniref:FAD:protein FMN transferase n=1 Tax=Amnibacterium soli TaxID=1282736 RepID=A0ABP8YT80_9MICO